ncbi:hypothetical protein [Amorphus orientalis]|uniref:Uncharacterized protein n=1 Tax=Amorphus orientalis TaxID=649198 RepID=A0AAE4AWG6_9HYPH|nr:hypothetical protein [Amorphus orientalis]MDQ0317744.1 hypothetical protein [Amorphus orientalis]
MKLDFLIRWAERHRGLRSISIARAPDGDAWQVGCLVQGEYAARYNEGRDPIEAMEKALRSLPRKENGEDDDVV